MTPAFELSSSALTLSIVAILFVFLYPIVLGVLARRRLDVPWRYFGYGALVFFVSQMLIRIPLISGLQLLLTPAIESSAAAAVGYGFFLAITAALFETGGRYLGYRFLMKQEEKTWRKGVMYGIGHGGIEAGLLVGAIMIVQVVTWTTVTTDQLAQLPPAAVEQITQTITAANQYPLIALAGAWERLWAVIFHVGMSVLVLQLFRRGEWRWFFYALALHTMVDFVVPTVLPLLGLPFVWNALASQILMTVYGLMGLWIVWAFREEQVEADQPQSLHRPVATS